MDKLLLIDDSTAFLSDVESLLCDRFAIVKATNGKRGIELARTEGAAAVLLDLRMPDMDGLQVLEALHRDVDPYLPVIIVTDHADAESAVRAMRLGAYDFIPKSFNRDVLSEKILKALERRTLELSVRALQSTFADFHDRFIFASEAMKRVHFELTRLAKVGFDVLITGETGAGKDLCAFEIHQRSPRRDRPFIPLAMRSLSETIIESELFGHEKGSFSGADKTRVGKLEAANGGTLYIPEVSSLTESVQLKLLQFMQYKSIARVGQDSRKPDTRLDVRVIMATNESLEDQVKKGKMRADFYHRISGVKLMVPPLRMRREDIGPLCEYFLQKYHQPGDGTGYMIAPEVFQAMRSYQWPGNVRELENSIKSALAYSTGRKLTLAEFPLLTDRTVDENSCRACMAARYQQLPTYDTVARHLKAGYFDELLQRVGGSIPRGAEIAGMSVQGLRKLLKGLKEQAPADAQSGER
jgi:two-component system, NtrC family, response regulator AtoC